MQGLLGKKIQDVDNKCKAEAGKVKGLQQQVNGRRA